MYAQNCYYLFIYLNTKIIKQVTSFLYQARQHLHYFTYPLAILVKQYISQSHIDHSQITNIPFLFILALPISQLQKYESNRIINCCFKKKKKKKKPNPKNNPKLVMNFANNLVYDILLLIPSPFSYVSNFSRRQSSNA